MKAIYNKCLLVTVLKDTVGPEVTKSGFKLPEDSKTKLEYLEAEIFMVDKELSDKYEGCLLYTSPSPRDRQKSRMPSSA